MPCTVVVGAQWGDEGKGKVVDALSAAADVVARYQGGPNAGHSIVRGGETVVLHLVPSGVMHPHPRCLIGNGVVIDLRRLREEVTRLEALGIVVGRRLGLSPAAHLILPYHGAVEAAAERGPGAIGTTGRGIGFAYRDKAASAAGAPLGVGLGPRAVDRVIGVTKAYTTRVGHGPFPSEMPETEATRLREAGEEYGATTGRPRRCGWLDLPALRYAARINGLDALVITKLDVLDGFERIRGVTAYAGEDPARGGFSADARALERCRPVGRGVPGWVSPTTSARRWGDLPGPARQYLEWIEREWGVAIQSGAGGAGREAEGARS